MSNGDKTKGSDYFELLPIAIAGLFGGVVKAVTNGKGTSLSSMGDMIQPAIIGLGAAIIFVVTLPFIASFILPLSALKDMIKRDRRLQIALALISGFIGEPIWTSSEEVVLRVQNATGRILEPVSPETTNEHEKKGQDSSSLATKKDVPQSRIESEFSESSLEQKAKQNLTVGNVVSESESSGNGGEEGTSRFSNKEFLPIPGAIESERPLDAGKEETTEVRDLAPSGITSLQISSSNGGGRTLRMSTAEENVPGYSSGLKIVQETFCLEMDRPQCKIPAVSENVSLSEIKTIENNDPQLYFWTSVEAVEDLEIMHVWSSSNRSDEWAEPIHVSAGAQFPNLMREMRMHKVKEYLMKNMNTNWHSTQAVLLALQRSDRFRTYSSIKAVPGRYTVEVRYLGSEKIVPGSESKTIIIDPSH